MAKPFFTEDWEKWTPEELSRARSRLAGFIEATPDKEKLLREVSLGKLACTDSEQTLCQFQQYSVEKRIFKVYKVVYSDSDRKITSVLRDFSNHNKKVIGNHIEKCEFV